MSVGGCGVYYASYHDHAIVQLQSADLVSQASMRIVFEVHYEDELNHPEPRRASGLTNGTKGIRQ